MRAGFSASSVLDILLFRATHDAEVLAVVESAGESMTYGQWAERSAAFRDGLCSVGVKPGQRVGLVFDRRDWIDFAVAYFGVMRSGAVPVPIENHLGKTPLKIAHADTSSCVVGDHCESKIPGALTTKQLSGNSHLCADSTLGGDSVLDIVYTSGTVDGEKKMVMCRHADWLSPKPLTPIRRQRRCVHALFETHSSAGVHGILIGHLERGLLSIVVAADEMYDDPMVARRMVDSVARYRPGEIMLTPALAGTLLRLGLVDEPLFDSVRRIKVGGSILPARIGHGLIERLPRAKVISLYGTTESAKALLAAVWDGRSVDRIGLPMGATEVRVLDTAGHEVSPGTKGEIFVRSRDGSGRTEYLDDADRTSDVFRSGWVRTGDLGFVDRRGEVHLVGRDKEMLVLSTGAKVNSAKIERLIEEWPETREVSVVGLARSGTPYDVVAAAIVTSAGGVETADIAPRCSALPAELAPARIVLVDTLPRNGMGKVVRPRVRALLDGCTESISDLRVARETDSREK